jgi:hypothetical protein
VKRFAFTIIFNGLHHLKHKDYYQFILDNFDHWVVAEGASLSNGSTSWCKKMPDEYHVNGHSVDGTLEFLKSLNNPKISIVETTGFWNSKDDQVNSCIHKLKTKYDRGYLWEIDCDEQWTLEDINQSEFLLHDLNLKTASFPARSWLGPNLQARGEWGECVNGGYTRLWNWQGELFERHEPPTLQGGNGKQQMLPIYFDHYNYYFEQDVTFKDKWYSGHEGILSNWKRLQTLPNDVFPLHIGNFFSSGWNRNTQTNIVYAN